MRQKFLSVSEAARSKKVSRQALYLAIREKKLKAYDFKNTLKILMSDLEDYIQKRWSRDHHSMVNGYKLFGLEKGFVTIDAASRLVDIDKQKLYYGIRTGKLIASRRNGTYAIFLEDLYAYIDDKQEEKERRTRQYVSKYQQCFA